MIYALALFVVSVTAILYFTAAFVRGLMDDFAAERAAHVAQIESLLQRIQAPEAAVMQHQALAPHPPLVAALPFDDDEAYKRSLSREELAASLPDSL